MKHSVEEIIPEKRRSGDCWVHVPDATVLDMYLNFRAGEYLVSREKWEALHLMEHVLLGCQRHLPASA